MSLMHLGGIIRQAVKLVRGVHIDQDEATFALTVFSIISWFKVRCSAQGGVGRGGWAGRAGGATPP